MSGRLFTANLTTTAETDLIAEMEALCGIVPLQPLKITIIADEALSIKINGTGDVYSPLYADPSDSKWKISLDSKDVLASTIVPEEDGVDIWIAIVF